MADKRFDLIIFGVTGYTGVYCLRNLLQIEKNEQKKYSFAVAGRSKEKIKSVLDRVGKEVDRNLVEEIEIIEANVADRKSLIEMTKKCRVLINVVGPYAQFGRPVVEACIETGTHHVDLSGEPQFLESVQVELHEQAKEKGVYIVGCCGFDSIPSDFGLEYLKSIHPDIRFNQVESFALVKDAKGKSINHGTYDSVVSAIANWRRLGSVLCNTKEKFFTRPYFPRYQLKKHILPQRDQILKKWTMPFWDTDKWVVRRTQMIRYSKNPQDYPVQFEPYMYIPHPFVFVVLAFYLPVFILLSLVPFTRKYVLDYPHVFSFGKFTKSGPTDEQVANSSTEHYLVAKGWKKADLQDKEPAAEPNVTRVLHIKSPEAAYDATSIYILLAGLTILEDLANSDHSVEPGVLTPGLAFRDTKLVERLRRNRIEFNPISA